MGEVGAEWSARFRSGGTAVGPGTSEDRARARAGSNTSHEPVPPPPVGPPQGSPTRAPVWSASETVAPVAPPDGSASTGSPSAARRPGDPDPTTVPRRRSTVATAFTVALLAFYVLQLAVAFLSWYDAEIRTPGQRDSMVAWALCTVVLLPALVLRGRWRALPLLLATLAGAVAPMLLSRDLLGILGVPDVWVGQALTLHVVFPLCLGLPATVAALLPGSAARR